MSQTITIKAGDTEPLLITVGANGVSNLNELTSAVLYAFQDGVATNHVDGAACTVHSATDMQLAFDPLNAKNPSGNAFDEAGTYNCYVKLVWSDGDETRHPNGPARVGQEWLYVVVTDNRE